MRKPAATAVVPETAAGDEDVDRAVVVVVAHRDGARAVDRVRGAREAAHAIIMEEAIRAGRARHKDVRAAVVVDIGDRGSGPALANPVRVRECTVEVVAIGGERSSAHEEQVEIAVVVEIDKDRAPGAIDVAHTGGNSHIVEPLAVAIMQQVAATIGADRKEVEPAIIVVVDEGRDDRAGGKRDRRLCTHVCYETAVDRVEPRLWRGDEEIVLAISVVIAPRQRRYRRAPVRQAALAGDIREVNRPGGRSGGDTTHRDE